MVLIPALVGPSLLRVWLGDNVPIGAADVLPVAVAYSAIAATAHVSSEFLAGSGRARIVVRWALAAVLVNLGLTIVLLPRMGVLGAFVSTLVTVPIASGPIVLEVIKVVAATEHSFVREVLVPVASLRQAWQRRF